MNTSTLLSAKEQHYLTRKSNWRGAWIIFVDYAIITGTFAALVWWPNIPVIIVSLFVLGGRQLALAVIVHECGHRTLFKSPLLNDVCGRWFGAYPLFTDMGAYMTGHWQHHRLAGTQNDPDLKNYRAYPVPRSSLRRKIWRDLSGQTGWRRLKSIGRALRHYSSLADAQKRLLRRSLLCNLVLLALLTASGAPWLYAMWVLAFVTTHMFIVRIRQIAEHAAVPNANDTDPRNNTRTVYANPLENLLFAPHSLNYHLEHHLLPTIPIYRLKQAHRLLKAKAAYTHTTFPKGYVNVLKSLTLPG